MIKRYCDCCNVEIIDPNCYIEKTIYHLGKGFTDNDRLKYTHPLETEIITYCMKCSLDKGWIGVEDDT